MEDFKQRSTASFGRLNLYSRAGNLDEPGQGESTSKTLTAESHLWLPSLSPIYRHGDSLEESSSDDEVAERMRRAVPVVAASGKEHSDFDEDFEYDEAVGSRPSIEFCSQLDKEEESDMYDIRSLQFDNIDGASPGMEPSSLGAPAQHDNRRALPPALKKSSSDGGKRLQKRHKRVSFVGLPEPPKPYVPPHKRHSGASMQPNDLIPDFVKNPTGYTHYEFDEPVVVGGGIVGSDDQMQSVVNH